MYLEYTRDKSKLRERNKTSLKQEPEKVGRKKCRSINMKRHGSMSKATQVKAYDIRSLLHS